MKKLCLFAIATFVITLLAFAAARSFGLVICDDHFYVCLHDEISNGLSLRGIKFALTDIAQSIWMPLTYFTYMLDYTLGWGYGGMHVQSILWHGLNSVLLFVVLQMLFKNKTAAFLAALVWAVHPLRVESVVWIASRKDVISTFFLLSALLSWLKAEKNNPIWLAASFVLLAIGAMAKPSVMVFPAFALGIDFLVTKKTKDPRIYWTLIALSVVIAMEASWAQRVGGATTLTDTIPLWYRCLNALASITIYLGNTIWPDALAMQCLIRYPDSPRFSMVGIAAGAILLAFALWIATPRVRRYLNTRQLDTLFQGDATANAVIAGLGIFFGCLVPFLGIAGFGVHAFADRFTILPALGLSIALCALLVRFPMKGASPCIVAAAVAALFLQTQVQTLYWEDNLKLVHHTLDVDRDNNVDAHRALGICYWDYERNMEKTYEHLKKAIDYGWNEEMKEKISLSAHFLIEACYATGRKQEAEDYYLWFRKVDYKHNGKQPSFELRMADALWLLNSKQDDRIQQIREILDEFEQAAPNGYLTAYLNYLLAVESRDQGRIDAAIERCARVNPKETFCGCFWAKRRLAHSSR